MKIVLASQNLHKKKEVAQILKSQTILIPRDLGIEFNVEETGPGFLDNAFIKARHVFEITGTPALADDSGLCVPALGGEPGIFSARYGSTGENPGAKLSDADRNDYLLEKLKGITDRRAYFVCCMVLLVEEARFFVAQETVHGEITLSPQGSNGFGYDPLFFLPERNRTVAQLTEDEKNLISHRGKATSALAKIISIDL